ncbi:hypothetical protein BO78DRAFT_443813 [Aspergillus sclerotiicarbonarius CBS 121057]|uniref:Uncharacterized protein n=1 Tax=Aspergillus sclerotiicarbonarius (strain CBS 121057 / IBT 28362) TaxID=1448318 RepID=A0A319EMR1_ASPSB|nr:hypothetical protein BO78DRAFT_443813 [Aspergillus sclerotiicarbonarius CBS 121057]
MFWLVPSTQKVKFSNTKTHAAELLMDDFSLALNTGEYNERLIRPRVDAILFQLLGSVKKENRTSGHNITSGPGSTFNDDDTSTISAAPCWASETKLSLAPFIEAEHTLTVDFTLRYGQNPAFDTNLVVLRKKTLLYDEGWGVLAAMMVIHRNRMSAREKGDIYGIYTDSYTWIFFHVSDDSKYSSLYLTWSDGQQEIIGHILQIIRQATILAQEVGGFDDILPLLKTQSEESSDGESYDWW